mgnify:CR=1 FL=1
MTAPQNETPAARDLIELVQFARMNGRTWKNKLGGLWMEGYHGHNAIDCRLWDKERLVDIDTSALQRIRNQFGPEWLVKFKLPK